MELRLNVISPRRWRLSRGTDPQSTLQVGIPRQSLTNTSVSVTVWLTLAHPSLGIRSYFTRAICLFYTVQRDARKKHFIILMATTNEVGERPRMRYFSKRRKDSDLIKERYQAYSVTGRGHQSLSKLANLSLNRLPEIYTLLFLVHLVCSVRGY